LSASAEVNWCPASSIYHFDDLITVCNDDVSGLGEKKEDSFKSLNLCYKEKKSDCSFSFTALLTGMS
jgi:hypothetical protein